MKVYIVLVDIDYEKFWEVKGVFYNKDNANNFGKEYKEKKEAKNDYCYVEIKIEEWDVK